MLLAVAVTLATPDALVTDVMFDKAALAPVDGGAKVTMAPLTGFPSTSFTVACSAFGKTVATVVDCPMAPVTVILAGHADMLLSEKVTAPSPPNPDTLAVTV
jgi:hypothetical protein